MTDAPIAKSIARRQVRVAALAFLGLGIGALAFDLLSPDPGQIRYLLGAVFLIGLSALTFHKARD